MKLKTNINNQQTIKSIMDEKTQLIQTISQNTNRYGNKLLEFMEKYQLTGLRDATITQLREFVTFIENQQKKEKAKLINAISVRSDRYGDKLVQFLDHYNLVGLQEASLEQLKEFLWLIKSPNNDPEPDRSL